MPYKGWDRVHKVGKAKKSNAISGCARLNVGWPELRTDLKEQRLIILVSHKQTKGKLEVQRSWENGGELKESWPKKKPMVWGMGGSGSLPG